MKHKNYSAPMVVDQFSTKLERGFAASYGKEVGYGDNIVDLFGDEN